MRRKIDFQHGVCEVFPLAQFFVYEMGSDLFQIANAHRKKKLKKKKKASSVAIFFVENPINFLQKVNNGFSLNQLFWINCH